MEGNLKKKIIFGLLLSNLLFAVLAVTLIIKQRDRINTLKVDVKDLSSLALKLDKHVSNAKSSIEELDVKQEGQEELRGLLCRIRSLDGQSDLLVAKTQELDNLIHNRKPNEEILKKMGFPAYMK